MSLTRTAFAAALILTMASTTGGQQAGNPDVLSATLAWDRGDYVTALNGFKQLLTSPGGDAFVDAVALRTGELYRTMALTADGSNPRFSPDGRMVSYETGSGAARLTRLIEPSANMRVVAEFTGYGGSFALSSDRMVYLKPTQADELRKAQADLDQALAQGTGRNALQQTLNWLLTRHADIVIRTLASGEERVCQTEGLLKSSPVFSADGQTIYFLASGESDDTRSDVYGMPASCGPAQAVTREGGFKGAFQVDPRGRYLVYAVATTNPFRRPAAPGQGVGAPGGRGRGRGQGGGVGGGSVGGSTSFGVVDVKSGATTMTSGSAAVISADGSTLAYSTRQGDEASLMVGPIGGAGKEAKKTRDRVGTLAVSPDGSRLAYQMMTKDDWEIFVINRDGSAETRVTREIQHDTLPRFVTNTLVLAATGEPRHMRSSLYDLTTLKQTRLFHNNTIRTIAPEYSWLSSADGRQILIVAERDGDTVSPERGIYLVPLDRKVTRQDVLARLDANLAAETDLRARGERMFRPIAAEVKRAVADVSTPRIFRYESALFDFDSKHITKPGNRLAGSYLFDTYKSFGYEPEYQWFEPRGALDGKTANVLATLRGTVNPELVYVVSSHYDSNASCPGADDDSSGTAALLEAARVLAKRPMPATIVFASFTGEEAGLLGSREFVRVEQAAKMKIVGALNNDMIGWANDFRLDNTIRYTNPGIRDVQHGASFFTKLITYDSLYYKSTDAAAFYEAFGDIVGGIGSYPVLGNPHYHQPTDLLETVNHELVAETSKVTVATIMLLASSPSRLTGLAVKMYAARTATLAWTPSPEKGVTGYIVAWGSAKTPLKNHVRVVRPGATISGVDQGTIVSVKAVNATGLEGWDWARTEIR